jgi:GMP synthase (glutamine-hydrolysing)
MNLQLCEPLKWLFKDEVRRVGRQLGMPEHLITRHPFPGPGLAVRILGDITPEKVRILQDADDIFIKGLRQYKVRLSGDEARRVLAAGVPTTLVDDQTTNSPNDQTTSSPNDQTSTHVR